MKYTRFEDLPVWRDAIELAVRTFALTAKPFRGTRYLTDKSRRTEKQRSEREEFLLELEQIRNRKS